LGTRGQHAYLQTTEAAKEKLGNTLVKFDVKIEHLNICMLSTQCLDLGSFKHGDDAKHCGYTPQV